MTIEQAFRCGNVVLLAGEGEYELRIHNQPIASGNHPTPMTALNVDTALDWYRDVIKARGGMLAPLISQYANIQDATR